MPKSYTYVGKYTTKNECIKFHVNKGTSSTGSGSKIKVNLQFFAKNKFPESSLSGKDVVKFLKKEGFTEVSQSGSHVKLNGPNREVVIVPVHGNKDLPKGTLNSIKKQAGY